MIFIAMVYGNFDSPNNPNANLSQKINTSIFEIWILWAM